MKHLFCLSLILCGYFAVAQHTRNVDSATFKKLLDEKKSALIDLRTNDEIARKGMIKNARQIDFFGKDAEKRISALNRDSTYLIYCAGGGRSGECAALMESMGFKHVVNLEKGFDDWKLKGYDVVKRP